MFYADILKTILEMSIISSALAIAVIIIRKAAKSIIPKNAVFILWIIVIAKLLIPVSIPTQYAFTTELTYPNLYLKNPK